MTESTSRRVGRPREIDDAAILRVARKLFLSQGVGISVQAVAKELGTSHTTLFNRFGSKEELLIAALAPPVRLPIQDVLDAGPADADVRGQLHAICVQLALQLEEVVAAVFALRAAGVPQDRCGVPATPLPGKPAGASVMFETAQALTGWLRAAQERGALRRCEVAAVTATVFGGLQGWGHGMRAMGEIPTEAHAAQYATTLLDVLWNGIAPDAA